jgi:hypothetical protein
MKKIIAVIGALACLIMAQGSDPHQIGGSVRLASGNIPSASCISYKVFVPGRPDTIRYPGDPRAIYSAGNWVTNVGGFCRNGDDLHIIFMDACSLERGLVEVTMDSTVPGQNTGTIFLIWMSIEESKSKVFSLIAAPTPFNSTCNIDIVADGYTRVEIYNVIGNSVSKLYEGNVEGTKSLTFSPKNMPAGIYFVKAVSENGWKSTQRVVFVP